MTVPENQTPDDSDVLPKTKKYIDQSTETNQVTIVKGWMNDNPNQMTNMLTTKEALNSFANQLQMRNKRDSSSSSETIDIINTLPNETKIDDKSVASPWVITPDVPADSAIANQYGITPVVQQKVPKRSIKPHPELHAPLMTTPSENRLKMEDVVEIVECKDERVLQEECRMLSERYPDSYWHHVTLSASNGTMIDEMELDGNKLEIVEEAEMGDPRQHSIMALTLSWDYKTLALFSRSGDISLWSLEDWKVIKVISDINESNVDEFYCGKFHPGMNHIYAGGKVRGRPKSGEDENDCQIIECPIKIFDLTTGDVVQKLSIHNEEITSIKLVTFKGEDYLLSTSKDGYIVRWKVSADGVRVIEGKVIKDKVTRMTFNVSFIPNTGNKFFICSVDNGIRLYNLETCEMVMKFADSFSCFCDCAKVARLMDFPQPPTWDTVSTENPMFAYILARGVEILDSKNNTINSKPNTVKLFKLIYASNKQQEFRLELVHIYKDENYCSNSWLVKLDCNGRYIAAPTYNGTICLFNAKSGKLVDTLEMHSDLEVRDVIFHPTKKLLLSCDEGGKVKIYKQK